MNSKPLSLDKDQHKLEKSENNQKSQKLTLSITYL